eukprot:SAG31_NODE_2416_length_5732_cov_1.503462_3_plen_376_part_00
MRYAPDVGASFTLNCGATSHVKALKAYNRAESMVGSLLSAEELQSYEQLGYVLTDAVFSPCVLDDMESAFDRVCGGDSSSPGARGDRCEDMGYATALAQPWFESVASQVLRSERVHLVENLPHHRPPAPDVVTAEKARASHDAARSWAHGCHIDWQVSTEDFEATPRRDMCAIWLWLSNVTPDRAAMRKWNLVSISSSEPADLICTWHVHPHPGILPRSHLAIQDHWQRVLSHEHRQLLPRNYGLFPRPSSDYPTYPQHIPEPENFPYTTSEPVPVCAKRGQALVFTQSMLHTGWENFTTLSRKALICSWVPAGVSFGVGNPDALGRHLASLRTTLAQHHPTRVHIVPTPDEYCHRSNVGFCEETFLPGEVMPKL